MIGCAGLALRVLLDAAALDLLDLAQQVEVDALGVIHVAVGVGAGHDLAAKLLGLLDGILRNVAGARYHDGLAVDGVALLLQHVQEEVDGTVAGGLRTREGSAVREALAREDGLPGVGEALVLAKHVADLAGARADVTGGDVGVRANVLDELRHEGLAEAHDLVVGLALGIEVRAALRAAHGKGGEGVLEDLLEAQELEDGEVHAGVQAQAALVGPDRGVELDAVAAVYLHLAGIVNPGHAEDHDALGLYEALEEAGLLVLGVPVEGRLQGGQDLLRGLDELRLVRVALFQIGNHSLGIVHVLISSPSTRGQTTLTRHRNRCKIRIVISWVRNGFARFRVTECTRRRNCGQRTALFGPPRHSTPRAQHACHVEGCLPM